MNGEHHAPRKIAIIGSGNIGSDLLAILHQQYPKDEIVVWNRKSDSGTAASISLDQREGLARKLRRGNPGHDARSFTFVSDDIEDPKKDFAQLKGALRGADIVIMSAGKPRKSPMQPRSDLAKDNLETMDELAKAARQIADENPAHVTNYIIASNPIGLLDQRFQEISQLPHSQVIGLSGELDAERLRQSIRMHLKLGYDEIRNARVLGDHGPGMVPLFSQIEVQQGGQWHKLLDVPEVHAGGDALLKEFKDAAVSGGGKFSKWNKQSDHRGPAIALAYMVEQIYDARFGDASKAQPVTGSSFHPESGLYTGQTVAFGRDGHHHRVDGPAISPAEAEAFGQSLELQGKDRAEFDLLTRHVNTAAGHARSATGG